MREYCIFLEVVMAEKPSYDNLQQMLTDLRRELDERRQVETDLENELRKFRALYDLALAMTE